MLFVSSQSPTRDHRQWRTLLQVNPERGDSLEGLSWFEKERNMPPCIVPRSVGLIGPGIEEGTECGEVHYLAPKYHKREHTSAIVI